LNAIIAKGNASAVTQADVAAQGALPVYKVADASQILANPVYTFVDADEDANLSDPIQAVRQISNGALQTTYQQVSPGSTTWSNIPADSQFSYMEPKAEFVMNADGTWSDMLTPSQWHQARPLSSIGTTLTGTDPATGVGFTYEERQVDLSGQLMSTAVAGETFGPDVSVFPRLNVPFASGTSGYLGLQSYSGDRVILPMGTEGACDFPYLAGDQCPTLGTGLNLPPYDSSRPKYNPNQPINDSNLPALTSVQQLVGRTLTEPVFMGADIQILPNGQAQFTVSGWQGPTTVVNGTWSVYSRNANVLVFNLSSADASTVATIGYNAWPIGQGAKLVMAIRNGQLQSGLLFPAGYTEKSIQFQGKLPGQLTPAL